MNIDFKEAVFGIEKEIQVRRSEECSSCSGTGAKPGSDIKTCHKCNGSGEVRYAQQTPFGQMIRVGTCDLCQGTGEVIEEKCNTCKGSGNEIKTRKIAVKIPPGVDNGSIISLRGEGEGGELGGPPGDLFIYISVNEDPIFKRQGTNIYLDIDISFTEAALGAEIDIPTLEGIEKFSIPAGTQTGSQFRLRHKGVANLRGLGKGDLIFRANIDVPTKLTDKQKELLIEFSKLAGNEYKGNKKGFFGKVKDAFN